MSVWSDLVGQEAVVGELRRAVADADATLRADTESRADTEARADAAAGVPRRGRASGMTHAWLFTGPPGSGRSTAARAFAAALDCEAGGCGICSSCRTVAAGTSPDVEVVSTSSLSHKVDDMRVLVQRAARHPVGGRWQVVIVEDADRLTDQAANALLKSVEEPPARTVWLLCAPTVEDVLPTVRSRCLAIGLRTPPTAAVADVLVSRDGVDPPMAAFAARATQGHIGRARRLATDEQARLRRSAALRLPFELGNLAGCLAAAGELVDAANEEAKDTSAELDGKESSDLARALGAGAQGRGLPTGAAAQLKDLERQQKARTKRLARDALDRALVDLAALYRDVLALQFGARVELINEELRPQLRSLASSAAPDITVRRIEAVLGCREAVEANVAPLLAVEAMTIALAADRATV